METPGPTRSRDEQAPVPEQAALLAAAFAHSAHGMVFVDPDFVIHAVNESFGAQAGVRVEDLAGRSVEEALAGWAPKIGRVFKRVSRSGKPFTAEAFPLSLKRQGEPTQSYWDVNILPVGLPGGAFLGYLLLLRDVTRQKRVEEETRTRVRRQTAIAHLGRRALECIGVSALVDEAVARIARTLEVEYVEFLETLPGGDALLLRAGVGWGEGLVGQAIVSAGSRTMAGYSLSSRQPVVVEDQGADTRFGRTAHLEERGVVSGASVVVGGRECPIGVLAAHTSRRRTFTGDDVQFLQAAAGLLACAVERARVEEALRSANEMLRVYAQVVENSPDMVALIDRQYVHRMVNPAHARAHQLAQLPQLRPFAMRRAI